MGMRLMRLLLVLSLVQILHGWRIPLCGSHVLSKVRCGAAPRRSFQLNAIRKRRTNKFIPVVQLGPAVSINEQITADPVRLIAPKLVHKRVLDKSDEEDDTDDDGDDYDEADEDGDEEEGEQGEEEEEREEGADDSEGEGEDEKGAQDFVAGEEMLGIYSLEDALQKARDFDLDLVLINDKADPPVCKITDYGKYKYLMERRKKNNLKKQIRGGIKEVKMSYKIDIHDFDVRVRSALKFIASGDRVSHTPTKLTALHCVNNVTFPHCTR